MRTSQPHRSARFDVLPGATRLAVNFIARGPEKSSAQLQQDRLSHGEEVERLRTLWKERLGHLASYLSRQSEDL